MPRKVKSRLVLRAHGSILKIRFPNRNMVTSRVRVPELNGDWRARIHWRCGVPAFDGDRFTFLSVVDRRVEILLHGEVLFSRVALLNQANSLFIGWLAALAHQHHAIYA